MTLLNLPEKESVQTAGTSDDQIYFKATEFNEIRKALQLGEKAVRTQYSENKDGVFFIDATGTRVGGFRKNFSTSKLEVSFDGSTWQELSVGGGSISLTGLAGEALTNRDYVIRKDDGKFYKTLGKGTGYVTSDVALNDTATVVIYGELDGFTGLVAGTQFYGGFAIDTEKIQVNGYINTLLDQESSIQNRLRTNYQIIKHVGDFDNGDGQVVDIFIDSNGFKNTVSTSLTNLYFSDNKYSLLKSFAVQNAIYQKTKDIANTGYSNAISSDGTKYYTCYSGSAYQYNLSTPFDISTATLAYTKSLSHSNVQAMFFSPDGTKLYFWHGTTNIVARYNLGTPWALNSSVYSNNFSTSYGSGGIFFSPNGHNMYLNNSNGTIYGYSLSTAWDVTTATNTHNPSVGSYTTFGLYFKPDGTKVYMLDSTNKKIKTYTLSGPWGITLTDTSTDFTLSQSANTPRGICISPDGLYMYIVDNTSVDQYKIGDTPLSSGNIVANTNTTPITDNTKFLIYKSIGEQAYSGTGDGTNVSLDTNFTSDVNVAGNNVSGIAITPLTDIVLKSITKYSGVTATNAYILDSTGLKVLETVSFSGNVATFSGTILLKANTNYIIGMNKQGASYTLHRKSTPNFPITNSDVSIYYGWNTNLQNYLWNITNIVTQKATVAQLTSKKVKFSDGTNETSQYTLDNNGNSVLIPRGSLNNCSNVIITETLETTDTNYTPTTEGYSMEEER